MALLKFLKGNYSSLSSAAIAEGQILICGDTGEMFVDVAADKRVKIGDYVTVASLDALLAIDATSVPTSRLYYVEGANILARSNGASWDQINKDTGATSIEVVGEGNAVTAASYDDKTRTLTLTKGTTFATEAELDDLKINVEKIGCEVYQVTSDSTDITVLASGITAKKGDVLIATNGLGVKSAYHYDETDGWIACDGMVDATTVILPENITMAGDYTAIGNLTKTKTGTKVFETAGKSVAAALTEILSKRLQPADPSQPAVTLTFSQAGAYEVGTEVTPSYSASLSAGSYTYGPSTGVTASEWTVTDTNGNSATTASGSFDKFTVADDTSYTITAKAKHNAGAVAKDNLGSDSNPVKQIAAGEKSKTSGAITGYRSYFYGVLSTSSETAPLTSAIVRGMTNGGAYDDAKALTVKVNGNTAAKRIVVAIPNSSTRAGVTKVMKTDGLATEITAAYVKTANAVEVEGVNGHTAVKYDVWVYEPASIDPAEVHEITLG